MGYMAPEIQACQSYDSKADVWSLGVLLYIMLTLRFPFTPTLVSERISPQQNGEGSPPLLDLDPITEAAGGATECADLLSQML